MDISSLSPITEVHLCSGVPLDNSYKDTLTFVNASLQYTFFVSKVTTSFTDLRPQQSVNKIKLPINAYSIYNCNYLFMKHGNFTNRWLYAFITDIQFISVNACEITFELDVMQTWYFDYNLGESFVEREHVNDDTIGANIIDENLNIGDYVHGAYADSGYLGNQNSIVIASTCDDSGAVVEGGLYCGVYSGLSYFAFNINNSAGVNAFIKALADLGKIDAIINIFMCPTQFIGEAGDIAKYYEISPIGRPNTLQGYTPKNNKLFTYPYCLLYVTNNNGNSAKYRYEFFTESSAPKFELEGEFSADPQICITPKNYKGIDWNYNEKLTLNGYPVCAWKSDVYANWFAQNKVSIGVGLASGIVGMATSAISMNPSAGMGGVLGIANQIGSLYKAEIQPPQAHGNTSSGSLNTSLEIQDFYFMQTTITAQFAQIIDEFFTMFGYKVNRVKIPNRTGRPYWNYVKTNNCKCTGSIPFNDISKIRSIYDAGITFWHGDYVGNYELDNR